VCLKDPFFASIDLYIRGDFDRELAQNAVNTMAEFYCTLGIWSHRKDQGCIFSVGDFGLWFNPTDNADIIQVMTWDYDNECLAVPSDPITYVLPHPEALEAWVEPFAKELAWNGEEPDERPFRPRTLAGLLDMTHYGDASGSIFDMQTSQTFPEMTTNQKHLDMYISQTLFEMATSETL
jgi:hypothetical protein